MSLFSLFVTSLLTQNIVLTKFLGVCPFMGTSDKEKNALGMGVAVTIVVTLSSLITYLLYHYVLVPTNSTYLKNIIFILVIASLVQASDILMKRFTPRLHKALGIYLPLITTNCAVLGIVLMNIDNAYTLVETLVFSLGSSLGFTLVIYIFASVREKLESSKIPKYFKGMPIAFIVAAVMSMLFSRFTG